MTAKEYRVLYTIVVDRPWLRGPSFVCGTPVGKRYAESDRYPSQGAAIRGMQRILDGQSDFPSEYVANVEIISYDGFKKRTIRKRIERSLNRAASAFDNHALGVTTLAVRAQYRGNSWRSLHLATDPAYYLEFAECLMARAV